MNNLKSSRKSVNLRNLSKLTKKRENFGTQEPNAAILKIGNSGLLDRYIPLSLFG
jgi:hypothetical protein